MSTDISKYSVVDPRIVQQKPKFAVEKGALSITNQTFSAIANSASQQTFQVQVPSENVFIDRAVDWVNTANVLVTLTYDQASDVPYGTPLISGPGADFSLAPFPVTQSVSTMQATINDQSLSINTADVLPQILRLADLGKTRKQRTCPTMLDRYYDVESAATYKNSPLGDYAAAYSNDEVPNGSWGQLKFQTSNATSNVVIFGGLPCAVQPFSTTPQTGVVTGTWYKVIAKGTYAGWAALGSNGEVGDVFQAAASVTLTGSATVGPALETQTQFTFGVQFTTAEKLVLPPFIFADEDELSTGLFGVQNMQFTMNFNAPGRSLRIAQNNQWANPPVVSWDSSGGNGSPFTSAVIQTQFLTPSLDVPLPAKSVVPWMEFPRYISPGFQLDLGTPSSPQKATLSSQTITLPMIPDLLIIFVKPQTYSTPSGLDPTQSDWSLPVTKIGISFDNYSGLLANHSQYELYKMSVNNGLEMDWDEWSGSAWAAGRQTPLVGGPLVLRPGRDFALSTGQAPGLIGNFTLQFDLSVENMTGESFGTGAYGPGSYGIPVAIYTVTANSGFFETIKGASRILRGVVTEQDILGAPVSEPVHSMERMVGEGKHHGHMSKHKKGMHAYVRS